MKWLHISNIDRDSRDRPPRLPAVGKPTPNLPTKFLPTKIAWLRLSGEIPMGMRIPRLKIQILLESNPLTSEILVRRLAVSRRYSRGDWLGGLLWPSPPAATGQVLKKQQPNKTKDAGMGRPQENRLTWRCRLASPDSEHLEAQRIHVVRA